jgi:phage head maturation protease
MSDLTNFYMPIGKVEKQDDGSRIVSGYASTPTKDLDGEIVSLDAIKGALPGYMEWRNIREMHNSKAVGRAQEANLEPDGLFLTAKIVDPACVKLIDEKVLQGFSIGGRKLAKKGDTITELELIEISVVDRPANNDCRFEIMGKSAHAGIELVKAADLPADAALTIPAEHVGPLRKFFSALFGKGGDAPGEGDKPYGDVTYADPGYQADGKKRYPIDTEAHIRAAWNYINKPKNAAKYKDGDVGKIKAKIVAAWKAKIDAAGPPSASEKGTLSPAMSKLIDTSVYDAGDALQALRQLMQVLEYELGEVEDEPEQVENLQEAIKRIKAFIASEIQEAPHKEGEAGGDDVEMAARAHLIADEDSALSNLRKELIMADNTLEKRFGAANKASMMKAKMHLGKAMACHGNVMKCMGKAASACSAMKAANKALSWQDIMKSDGVAGHIADAVGHMESMADHHELAMSHMGKAASGFAGEGGGAGLMDEDEVGGQSGSVSQAELTEGDVPEYTSDEAYPGKGVRGGFTKAVVEKMIADAVKTAVTEQENTMLKATVEALRAQPGPNKSRAFAFDSSGTPFFGKNGSAGATDPMSLLLEGVDMNVQSEDAAIAASRKMLTNMFAAPATFGKSVMSADFKGRPVRPAN